MRRLIVTGTTDSNGRVTIEYTGTGAGRVQVTAETSDGSLSSETYELIDALIYDPAIQNNHKEVWKQNYCDIAYDINGLTMTSNDDTRQSYIVLVDEGTTTYTTFNTPITIEFDLVSYTGSSYIDISANNGNRTRINFHVGGTGHWKFVVGPNTRQAFKDGVDVSSTSGLIHTPTDYLENPIKSIGFFLSAEATSLKFKNFMVY